MALQTELLEALLGELEPMAEEMVTRMRVEIPSFNGVPRDEHLRDTRESMEQLIRGSLGGQPAAIDAATLADRGGRRAAQGVPVEDLLRAWRLSITIGTEHVRALAEEQDFSAQLVVAGLQEVLEAADAAMVSLSDGHRVEGADADAEVVFEADVERETFVRGALAGELGVETLRGRAGEYGLDLTRGYRALRASGSPRELAALSKRMSRSGGETVGLFAADDPGLVGFSALDTDRGIGGLVATGPPAGLESLAGSNRIAMRVHEAARRFGLLGLHDLTSAGLHVAVLEVGDVGAALLKRYVEPVRAASNGEELLASLRAWFEAGMRVDPASGRLHVHENTLRYRLDRYAELTGVDLSVSDELVAVWWALHRDQLERPAG